MLDDTYLEMACEVGCYSIRGIDQTRRPFDLRNGGFGEIFVFLLWRSSPHLRLFAIFDSFYASPEVAANERCTYLDQL